MIGAPFRAQLDQHQITDLVLHGDRRPYHIVAAEEARARGIAVFATDLGYVRPDWITLEYDGMTTYSRFPRDPDAIRALAAELGPPDLEPRFQNPFWMIATFDIAYNLGLVFGRPLFPRYRYHSIVHPFAEYAGWLCSRGRRLFTDAGRRRREGPSAAGARVLFSRAAAAGDRLSRSARIRRFATAARRCARSSRPLPAAAVRRELVFIAHPLDNGLIAWDRVIARLAREFGVADRVLSLPGGTPARAAAQRRRGRDDQQHDRDHGVAWRGSREGARQCRFRCSRADLPGAARSLLEVAARARPGSDGRLPARAGRHDAGQGRILRARLAGLRDCRIYRSAGKSALSAPDD